MENKTKTNRFLIFIVSCTTIIALIALIGFLYEIYKKNEQSYIYEKPFMSSVDKFIESPNKENAVDMTQLLHKHLELRYDYLFGEDGPGEFSSIRDFSDYRDNYFKDHKEELEPAFKEAIPYLAESEMWEYLYNFLNWVVVSDKYYRYSSSDASSLRANTIDNNSAQKILDWKGDLDYYILALKIDVIKKQIQNDIDNNQIRSAYNKMIDYGYELEEGNLIDGAQRFLTHFGCNLEADSLNEVPFGDRLDFYPEFWDISIESYPESEYEKNQLIELRKNIIAGNKPIISNDCAITFYE